MRTLLNAASRISHATVGLAFQGPDRQIFAGRVRAEVEFGPRNLGRRGAELTGAVDGALEGDRPSMRTRPPTRTTSATRGASSWPLPRSLRCRRPSSSLTSRRPGRTPAASPRIQAIIKDLSRAGTHCRRHQPRMRFVAETFDRVIVMRAGKVVLDGDPSAGFFAERLVADPVPTPSLTRRWPPGSGHASASEAHADGTRAAIAALGARSAGR